MQVPQVANDKKFSALLTRQQGGASLDQFYTKPRVAAECLAHLQQCTQRLGIDLARYWFIEPSAGCGCFFQHLPPRRRIGIDLEPKTTALTARRVSESIITADYLCWQPTGNRRNYLVIGNPPFGKRGKLAVDFFNHSAFADFIAFIVPVSFRKYGIHRQLSPNYALISQLRLGRDSFQTPDLKPYAVNAEFQVWTKLPNALADRRQRTPPPISHVDFAMYQYNNTAQALKQFRRDFDFAVPCQGYQDYSRRETRAADCEKNKQWMLFKAAHKQVRERLHGIDYHQLAMDCATVTPGFRKNDVVRWYLNWE